MNKNLKTEPRFLNQISEKISYVTNFLLDLKKHIFLQYIKMRITLNVEYIYVMIS